MKREKKEKKTKCCSSKSSATETNCGSSTSTKR